MKIIQLAEYVTTGATVIKRGAVIEIEGQRFFSLPPKDATHRDIINSAIGEDYGRLVLCPCNKLHRLGELHPEAGFSLIEQKPDKKVRGVRCHELIYARLE